MKRITLVIAVAALLIAGATTLLAKYADGWCYQCLGDDLYWMDCRPGGCRTPTISGQRCSVYCNDIYTTVYCDVACIASYCEDEIEIP